MTVRREYVLAGLLVLLALTAGAILRQVIVTVFFAITVAAVLVPLFRRLVDVGLPRWWAGVVATAVAFLALVALLLPLAVILYVRRRQLLAAIELVPESITLEYAGFAYVIEGGEAVTVLTRWVTGTAIELARAAPVIALKAFLLGIVVFALLLRGRQLRRAVLAPVPTAYHDVVIALDRRVRGTLFALYVVQAMTAAATFLIALPVFVGFGYGSPVVLAVVAGVLQFLPIVGPSLLLVGLAVYELSLGAAVKAVLLLAIGAVLIGFLPDALVRPRLARETASLPGSLYFVGFTGGLLTLGPVGIIAGPLVVAVLLEVLSLLADEVTNTRLEFQG